MRFSIKSLFFRVIKSPTFTTLGIFASANIVSTALSGVGGIIQARWVSPETLGQFHKYGILTSYLALMGIVIKDGLVRQFPYLIGKGLKEEAMKVASVAKLYFTVTASIYCVIFSSLTVYALVCGDMMAATGWGVQIVAATCLSYGGYMQTIYRRSMEFKRLSYNGLFASSLGFAGLIFVKVFGYYGLAIKSVLISSVQFMLDAKYIPMKIKRSWDSAVFLSLAKISIPLSFEGYIRTSFSTATFGFLVVHYCSAKDLGVYGIAFVFESFAMLFVTSMMQIFDVKMTNRFGETDSVRKSFKALVLPTCLGVFCALILAGGLCLLIEPFIRIFVPKYVEATPVVYVLSAALPISILGMPTRLLRVALQYRWIYVISVARIVSLVLLVQFVPRTIVWFAGCKVATDFFAVLLGYLFLALLIKRRIINHE